MALSNKFGWLVLTTGNKTEISVGYSTLYGDMAGGFAVIKDVLQDAWSTAGAHAQRGRGRRARAATIIERPPSAELRDDQLDEDSLPPYERARPRSSRATSRRTSGARRDGRAAGCPPSEVERVIRMVDSAEYKRRQAPPGIKITTRAFGRDRRMPITNRYRVAPVQRSTRLA